MGYDPFSGDHAAQQLWPTSRQHIELPAEVQPLELPEDVAAFEHQADEGASPDIGDYRAAPPIINTDPMHEVARGLAGRLAPKAIAGALLAAAVTLATMTLLFLLLRSSMR